MKYVLPAAFVALIVFVVFGGGASAGAPPPPDASGARGLPMLIVPALVIALLLRGRHLVEGLLFGVLAAVVTSVGLGLVPWSRVIAIDAANFTATGLVIDGITRGLGVSVFTILLTGLVATVKAAGVVDRLAGADSGAVSPRAAEVRIFSAVSAAVLLTTHSVVAILTVGELAGRVGTAAGLTAYRRANVLDVTVCTYPFLLPYFIPPILAGGATRAGEAFGMPRVSPFEAGLHNVYSWALLVIVVAAIVTGYGRTEGTASTAG